ncbi:MAG: hypothetical protein M3280_11000 [Actinomycetota bacterium]|nr:hypothetical protein [Actinomycetota bacterium]
MSEIHRYVGFVVPAVFLIVGLYAIAAFVRNKSPGENFWRLLAGAQVVFGIQVVIGGILYLVLGRRGPEWRHYTYGLLFPFFLLLVGHQWSRRNQDIAWIVFGAMALLNFGLTFMALRTGLEFG